MGLSLRFSPIETEVPLPKFGKRAIEVFILRCLHLAPPKTYVLDWEGDFPGSVMIYISL